MEQRILLSVAVSEGGSGGNGGPVAVLWQGHYALQVPMVLSAGGGLGPGPTASLLFILTSSATVHPATRRPQRADTLLRR